MTKQPTEWDKKVIAELEEIDRRIESGEERLYTLEEWREHSRKTIAHLKKQQTKDAKRETKSAKAKLVAVA